MDARADKPVEENMTGDRGSPPSLGELGLNRFSPYLMNRIIARWNTTMQEALRDHDLTTAKMRTLAVLSVVPGLTINELSVYAVFEPSTMSRTLDALEADGLVRRVAHQSDGRVREIHLTDAGREAFAQFWPEMYEGFRSMFSDISLEEEEAFLATLQKILKNIRKHEL